MTRTVKTFNADKERRLLEAWISSVQFDKPSDGIPLLDPEEDDDEDMAAKDRAALLAYKAVLSSSKMPSCKFCKARAEWKIKSDEGQAVYGCSAHVDDMEEWADANFEEYDRPVRVQSKIITPGGRIGSDRRRGSRTNRENWVERSRAGRGSLPWYIRVVRNGLMKQGHSESRATALAVAAMKRWARGGDNVTPKVQAAAARALAQWEAMKAEA